MARYLTTPNDFIARALELRLLAEQAGDQQHRRLALHEAQRLEQHALERYGLRCAE
jgi:hypothetical protein